MFPEEQTLSEEFKPIRITLSEEAFYRMEKIMKDAKLRSYSSTIEECIRAIYDIITEIHAIGGKRGDPQITILSEDVEDGMMRIIFRMQRLTGRRPAPHREKK